MSLRLLIQDGDDRLVDYSEEGNVIFPLDRNERERAYHALIHALSTLIGFTLPMSSDAKASEPGARLEGSEQCLDDHKSDKIVRLKARQDVRADN